MTEQMKQPEPTPAPAPQPEPTPAPASAPQPEPMPAPAPLPEPTPQPANAYESIIEQQQQQITALMEQTKMLNEQIVNLVNNGGQLNQFQVQPHPQSTAQSAIIANKYADYYGGINNPAILQPSLEDNQDYTLESLAKDIGKKPKRV